MNQQIFQSNFKKSLISRIRARYLNRNGQSTTEYILILAIVVMLATKVRQSLSNTIGTTLQTVDTQLNQFNTPGP